MTEKDLKSKLEDLIITYHSAKGSDASPELKPGNYPMHLLVLP